MNIVEEMEKKALDEWGVKYNFLSLELVKKDFQEPNTKNPTIKAFKTLIQNYRIHQDEFETSSDNYFSPYCIGYGNITSPIWFLGEAEGGPDNIIRENIDVNGIYNMKVKSISVLNEQHINTNVFVNPYELVFRYNVGIEPRKKYEICKDTYDLEKYYKNNIYTNFDYAAKILRFILTSKLKTANSFMRIEEVGKLQFFTEFWRYRYHRKKLPNFIKNRTSIMQTQDKCRQSFLKKLDEHLKPQIVIAYKLKPLRQTLENIFGAERIHVFETTSNLRGKRPVILTDFLGRPFSNPKTEKLGVLIRNYLITNCQHI